MRVTRLELALVFQHDSKSCASTNSAIPADYFLINYYQMNFENFVQFL